MTQVRIAFGAHDFGANHTVAAIHFFGDPTVSRGSGEAGPTASSVKLGVGLEQGLATADTSIKSGRRGLIVLASKWRLSGFLARYCELARCEISTPLVVGLFDFVGHA
jgi:hypothetical protein